MTKTIHIYYINLDRSPERAKFIKDQFNSSNIKLTRVQATDGSSLDQNLISEIQRSQSILEHFQKPKPGEIGAFFSHQAVWNLIANQDEDFSIVIEDDVIVDQALFDDFICLISDIDTEDIIDISGRKGFVSVDKKPLKNNISLTRYSTPPLGMTGKIIGKQAAVKLYNFMPEYLSPVDVMVQKVYQHKVCIWSTNKCYIKHADQLVGGTTIQTKDRNFSKKILRELKRPLWRAAIKFRNLIA